MPNPAAPQAVHPKLISSLSSRCSDNPDYVKSARVRVVNLVYSWVRCGSTTNPGASLSFELLQSIINGEAIVRGVDGRVDINGRSQRYLESVEEQLWQEESIDSPIEVLINYDHQQEGIHGFGASWR